MERDGYEKIAYKVLESPKFWFYPDRIKELTGLTYWAEVEQVMRILSDREFISKARESYGKLGAKYPSETAKVALENIKAIEEVMRWGRGAVPQAVQRVKEPWQMSISEFAKYRIEKEGLKGIGFLGFPHGETAQLHRKAIEQALREGKPVPKELLEFYKGELKVTPKVKPVTPEVTKSILDEQITTNKNNIRAWFKEPANWANKERLTYREVAQQLASEKDLIFTKVEIPIDPSRPLGETKAIYQVELSGKKLREFPKEVYDYYQSIKSAIPKAEAGTKWNTLSKYAQIPKTDIHAVPRCRVPATLHPYAPPARQLEDEMEKLFRSDPAEFYRRKKLVNQAIKEREGGKIKTLPDFSLTDLRRIKAHADSLYG